VWHQQNRDSANARRKKLREEHPELERAQKAAYNARYPERRKAQNAANYAQEIGRIVKPANCQGCGLETERLDKHHFDYDKPLQVTWLCDSCHGLIDQRRRARG
jgi:hypothetical protein